jgi:hypothetical protein
MRKQFIRVRPEKMFIYRAHLVYLRDVVGLSYNEIKMLGGKFDKDHTSLRYQYKTAKKLGIKPERIDVEYYSDEEEYLANLLFLRDKCKLDFTSIRGIECFPFRTNRQLASDIRLARKLGIKPIDKKNWKRYLQKKEEQERAELQKTERYLHINEEPRCVGKSYADYIKESDSLLVKKLYKIRNQVT